MADLVLRSSEVTKPNVKTDRIVFFFLRILSATVSFERKRLKYIVNESYGKQLIRQNDRCGMELLIL